jgi:LacI family transcriptional regulator
MKRLQLEDLAKQLGYSKTLISMVLNGKGDLYGISKKTQVIVMDAVSQLDYTPNKFAKALRTGKSYFIGLIVADISNPFYSKIAKNIESALFDKGYNLMVCSTEENKEREKRLVDNMYSQQGVDGLIIASTLDNAEYYQQPRFERIPLVFIDRVLPLFNSNYVVIDNYGGSVNIINSLVKQHCKTIACFSITPSYISTIEDRINGYKEALEKNKLAYSSHLLKSIGFDKIDEDVEKSLTELIKTQPNLDAIYCLNNNIATSLLKTLKQKQFRSYSSKIKIACFDDIDLFNIIDTPITSVSQPIEDIGLNASSVLLDIIDGVNVTKNSLVLSTKLIER